jgi:hypothetical protein
MIGDRVKSDVSELAKYDENRRNSPARELTKYAGFHVAFSLDGSRILASGRTIDELEENVAAAGLDPTRVVHSYIDPALAGV